VNNYKRILIDGRFVGVGDSVSRQTLETAKAVIKIDQKNEYTLLLRPIGLPVAEDFFQPKPKNLNFVVLDIKHYSLAEQTKLLGYLIQKRYDLVHFMQFNHPIFYRGAFVVNILDLTLFKSSNDYQLIKYWGLSAVMNSAIRNSKKIITVSMASKKEIVDRYKIDPMKIVVTYLGVDSTYNLKIKNNPPVIANFRKKYQIDEGYLLYAGMWKKHKNLDRLLEAFYDFRFENSELKNQLVIVGKADKNEPQIIEKIESINQKIGPNAVIITGFVPEPELPLAYAGALIYITPSLSEGFGLTPLEAIACGTPVAAARISATPEILDDAALYFDPYDIEDIKNAIKKLTTDEKLQDDLREKGKQRIKDFSWEMTGERTEAVYRSILK
jgi:glycosyltransferase involved in cell wall biosynthesis